MAREAQSLAGEIRPTRQATARGARRQERGGLCQGRRGRRAVSGRSEAESFDEA